MAAAEFPTRVIAGALLLGATLGCVFAAGVPAGPIAEPRGRVGAGYVFAYAPASARALDAEGTARRVSGNGAIYPSFPGSQLIPSRIGMRYAFSRSFDFGLDVNWGEAGLQLRAGPLDAARELPWGVQAEWRTGLTSLAGKRSLLFRRNIFRLRAEAYPALPFGRSGSGLSKVFAVTSLGLSSGAQLASLWIDSSEGEGPLSSSLDLLRWETRLEFALGLHWLTQPAQTLAFQPWITLPNSGLLRDGCDDCGTLTPQRLSSGWGFSVAWTFYLVFEDPHGPDARHAPP